MIKKSTGEVLLSQDNTAFTFGEEAYPVADASNVVEDSSGIHGNLIVETAGREKLPGGAPDRGQVTFTFLRPEVLQVQITYNSASPSEVSEQFNDQGEHYYGIWDRQEHDKRSRCTRNDSPVCAGGRHHPTR